MEKEKAERYLQQLDHGNSSDVDVVNNDDNGRIVIYSGIDQQQVESLENEIECEVLL